MRVRRQIRALAIAALCWAIAPGCFADEVTETALAEETGQVTPADESQGAGMVIELDDSAPASASAGDKAQQPPMQQRELADSEVEMIVGGAGKDGVAKRGKLKRAD